MIGILFTLSGVNDFTVFLFDYYVNVSGIMLLLTVIAGANA